MRPLLLVTHYLVNPFLLADTIWHICSRRLLKSLWKIEKFVIMSNFTLCHNLFNFIKWLYIHIKRFSIVSLTGRCFQSCLLNICCRWKRIKELDMNTTDAFLNIIKKILPKARRAYAMALCPSWVHKQLLVNAMRSSVLIVSQSNLYSSSISMRAWFLLQTSQIPPM